MAVSTFGCQQREATFKHVTSHDGLCLKLDATECRASLFGDVFIAFFVNTIVLVALLQSYKNPEPIEARRLALLPWWAYKS